MRSCVIIVVHNYIVVTLYILVLSVIYQCHLITSVIISGSLMGGVKIRNHAPH